MKKNTNNATFKVIKSLNDGYADSVFTHAIELEGQKYYIYDLEQQIKDKFKSKGIISEIQLNNLKQNNFNLIKEKKSLLKVIIPTFKQCFFFFLRLFLLLVC